MLVVNAEQPPLAALRAHSFCFSLVLVLWSPSVHPAAAGHFPAAGPNYIPTATAAGCARRPRERPAATATGDHKSSLHLRACSATCSAINSRLWRGSRKRMNALITPPLAAPATAAARRAGLPHPAPACPTRPKSATDHQLLVPAAHAQSTAGVPRATKARTTAELRPS